MAHGRQGQGQSEVHGSESPDRAVVAEGRHRPVDRIPAWRHGNRVVPGHQLPNPGHVDEFRDGNQTHDDAGEHREVEDHRHAAARERGPREDQVDQQELRRRQHIAERVRARETGLVRDQKHEGGHDDRADGKASDRQVEARDRPRMGVVKTVQGKAREEGQEQGLVWAQEGHDRASAQASRQRRQQHEQAAAGCRAPEGQDKKREPCAKSRDERDQSHDPRRDGLDQARALLRPTAWQAPPARRAWRSPAGRRA